MNNSYKYYYMGLFDRLKIKDKIKFKEIPNDINLDNLEWQSKSIDYPFMNYYKLENNRLFKRERKFRKMSEEELNKKAQKNGYENWEEWENDEDTIFPIEMWKNTVDEEWWTDTNYNGCFTFYTSTHKLDEGDDFVYYYNARFTDGELDEIIFLDKK